MALILASQQQSLATWQQSSRMSSGSENDATFDRRQRRIGL
jgi:hypothetical protein